MGQQEMDVVGEGGSTTVKWKIASQVIKPVTLQANFKKTKKKLICDALDLIIEMEVINIQL